MVGSELGLVSNVVGVRTPAMQGINLRLFLCTTGNILVGQ